MPARLPSMPIALRPVPARACVPLGPARACVPLVFGLMLPLLPPAHAQMPTQTLVPQAAVTRPVSRPASHPASHPAASAPTRTPGRTAVAAAAAAPHETAAAAPHGTAAAAPHRTAAAYPAAVPVPAYSPPLDTPPPPDRGRQIIELQIARRPSVSLRPMEATEAAAIWRGYTSRIGKAPSLGGTGGSGSGSGGGSGGGGGGGGGGGQ